MRFGFPISLLLHALILGWGLIAMKSARDFKKLEVQSIALEIITADELAQMRKGDEKSKELEAKAAKDAQGKAEREPPKPKVTAAPPPPPPPPPEPAKPEPVKEEPKPDPIPDPIKEKIEQVVKPPEPPPPVKPEPKPEAADALAAMKENEPQPVPKAAPPVPAPKPPDPPKVVEKKPPPPPKPKPPVKLAEAKPPPKPAPPANKPSTFEEQMRKAGLAADAAEPDPLLNKDPRRQQAAQTTVSADPASRARTAAGTRDGQAARTSQSEINALAGQLAGMIKACYRAQAGNAVEREDLIVKLRFDLTPDGMLRGEPIVLEPARFALGTQWAVNALKGCQPYRLDPDKYQGWKEWDFNFRP